MKLAVFLLCFMSLYCVTEACKCLPLTNKEKYCNSDFVFYVEVTTSLINENGQQDFDDYYEIEVIKKYKNEKGYSVTDNNGVRLYTGTNSALCGVDLKNGQTYLISGTVSDGRRNIDSCNSWIQTTIDKPALRLIKLLKKRPYLCKKRVSPRY